MACGGRERFFHALGRFVYGLLKCPELASDEDVIGFSRPALGNRLSPSDLLHYLYPRMMELTVADGGEGEGSVPAMTVFSSDVTLHLSKRSLSASAPMVIVGVTHVVFVLDASQRPSARERRMFTQTLASSCRPETIVCVWDRWHDNTSAGMVSPGAIAVAAIPPSASVSGGGGGAAASSTNAEGGSGSQPMETLEMGKIAFEYFMFDDDPAAGGTTPASGFDRFVQDVADRARRYV
jgi:hypothetical protein